MNEKLDTVIFVNMSLMILNVISVVVLIHRM